MNRRDFLTGLFTGCVIAAFIVSVVVCIRIVARVGGEKADERITARGAQSADVTIKTPDAADMPDVSEASVLSDPEVVGKIDSLETMIRENYIDDVTAEQLADGLYAGIMDAIDDPYAEYYTPEEWIAMQQDTAGIYYGIGAYLTKDTDMLYPRITGVIKNTPAEESGLLEDDYIVEVNHEDVYDMDLSDVVAMIKGEEGTKVHLTIIRRLSSGNEELEFDVARRRVETPTVTYEMEENHIAYIQISEFDSVTVQQFEEALNEAKNARAEGLIIDLRSNPGGSLSAVVRIAQMLLPKGRIVYTEDKYGHREVYDCDGTHEIEIPLAVLVNGNSASASEILAGAIKDYGIGTLIGTTTFGKGIVQKIFTLSDGSAMKLTVSHYYTPLGNDIHKIGIEPDEIVEFDRDAYQEDGTDNQLEAALALLKGQIK